MAEDKPGSSDGKSADLAATEEGNVVSMVDVLQVNQELEAEATAVLGDSDDKCCTYLQGYLSRQALYACGTCSSAPNPPAGVCLACSYECHEGHELFELYTKRNFRCDCGNSKFPNLTCKLEQNKAATNADNKYNDNFHGVYCICKRPYPDPEDETEDEMIQCVVCEDWYHGRHLGGVEVPDNEDYQEMVCCACMKRCDFLWAYGVHSLETKIVQEETIDSVDVEGNCEKSEAKDPGSASTSSANSKESTKMESSAKNVTEELKTPQNSETKVENDSASNNLTEVNPSLPNGEKSNTTPEAKPAEAVAPKTDVKDEKSMNKTDNCIVKDDPVPNGQQQQQQEDDDSQMSSAETRCKLKELQARGVYRGEHATFWPTGWRSKLCVCDSCKSMYEEKYVAFLTDSADSVLAYEQRGLSRQTSSSSQYEQGMEALSNMNRIQQVEMLHGFNDLKAELTNYLKDFADQGKVVKTEDINKFFDDMQARKRQRVGEAGAAVQYHCR
ncbi:putative E3 ubiquitin-protein ligase UBR7 [Amphiura filiformis]|uniref:putative E3 ubiquitin-protein ligase UBR7 n=1 Tax=Amphiura filiformis TaxID=82378 RepID=UPI003B2160B8